jgi:hypothetical protein
VRTTKIGAEVNAKARAWAKMRAKVRAETNAKARAMASARITVMVRSWQSIRINRTEGWSTIGVRVRHRVRFDMVRARM